LAQYFEGGAIFYRISPIAVRAAVFKVRDFWLLRYPVSQEYCVNSGESDSIQYCQRGVVTRQYGKYEVWLRPDVNADADDQPAPPLTRSERRRRQNLPEG